MKERAVQIARIAIPVAILGWLLNKEWDAIQGLVTRPKDFTLILASFACLFSATCLSFIRWYFLVKALEIPFTLGDAFRIGLIGYLFNFVGPSAVGGDLFKAYLVVRDQSSRRAEAVATIFLDRLAGMYALFIVATVAIPMVDVSQLPELDSFLRLVMLLTLVGTIVLLLLLSPSRYSDWGFELIRRLPLIGRAVARVQATLELYRRRRLTLIGIGLISITVHLLVAISIHFADRSVHATTPSLPEHMVISPLGTLASAAPVPGGLGTFEFAMDYMYQEIPAAAVEPGQGLSVAVIYRLLTVAIAMVGAAIYLFHRREVLEAVTEIEADQAADTGQH